MGRLGFAGCCSSLIFSVHSTTLPLTCAARVEMGSYFLLFKTAVGTSPALFGVAA